MGLRRKLDGIARLGTGLLAAAAVAWTGDSAMANQFVHVKRMVWGCIDPNVVPSLNDYSDPRRSDPQWVAKTSALGQCVTISTRSLWETLSEDHNGLTYVAYRGTIGRPGSFWVPTAAIDFTPPVEAATPPPAQPYRGAEPSPPEAAPVLRAPPPVHAIEPPATPSAQASVAHVADSELPPAPEPIHAPAFGSPEAPTTGTESAGGGVAVLLFLLGAAWTIRRSLRKASARRAAVAKNRATSARGAFDHRASAAVSFGTVRVDGRSSVPAPSITGGATAKNSNFWHPPGDAVTIAGATVADGMIYVGRGGRPGDHDASFIDPALPVARSSASAGPLGYWPSYSAITPECRRRYLEWLASGKRAPEADLGYVFLYFYGLERRLLLDEPSAEEVRALVGELERLRTIYAGSRSFDGYSRRLIEAVSFLQRAEDSSSAQFVPDLAAPPGEMPFALKVAIAREVVAGRPLGFELAAAALFGIRDFWSVHRHVLDKGRPAFLAVLRVRFATAFPTGFMLRNRKDSRLRLAYHGASAGLQLDLAARMGLKDLPDPATLTWTKLLAHAAEVAAEIVPYAKALAYHPARANSLCGLIICPAELREAVAVEARRWLEGLPSPAAVTFGELASHALGTATGKWTVRHRRDVSEALSTVGYAMEPDPEDGAERIEDATVVQVFRWSSSLTRSRALEVASAAAMLVAAVGRTADGGIQAAAEHWLSQLPSRLSLTSEETTRLRARLGWYGTKGVTAAKAKRLLGEATQEEKALCAWSATVAAGATGDVGKPQIAALEAIHDALGVQRGALYSGLHAGIGATAAAATEPVLVSDEVREVVHPIPRPPSAAEPIDPDPGRLDRVRAETEQVFAMLAEIFVEEDETPPPEKNADTGPLAGLDAEHAALLTRLLSRTEWSRDEFDGAASEAGLMPSGAMETINEWAFDHHGDALLEDGETVFVNLALLGAEAAAAE